MRDGQEALDYLYRRDGFEDTAAHPMPQIILLDLNLPKRDGREVLKIIKEDATLKDIPVVIVSTSDREEDVNYARQYGIAAYVSKGSGFEQFNAQLAAAMQLARSS